MSQNNANFCLYCGHRLEQREQHGEARLCCSSSDCDYVHWNNPTPVVAAIVEHQNYSQQGDRRIIIARNHAWPDDWYGLITGFLEQDEAPAEAVLREVKEELNLSGTSASFVGHYPFPKANEIIMAYHVPVAHGEISLNEELVDYKAVAPEKIKPWPFGTGLALQDWLRKQQ